MLAFRLKTGTVDSSYRWWSNDFCSSEEIELPLSSASLFRPRGSLPTWLSRGPSMDCNVELHRSAATTNFGVSKSPATPESSYCSRSTLRGDTGVDEGSDITFRSQTLVVEDSGVS
ncbi:hypothetical protein BDW72DRAFT_196850 [Aspergillus terricola var. indicus]